MILFDVSRTLHGRSEDPPCLDQIIRVEIMSSKVFRLRSNSRHFKILSTPIALTLRKTIVTFLPFDAYLAARSIALFPHPITTTGPSALSILTSATACTWLV